MASSAKVNGAWKTVTGLSVKVGGQWKTATSAFIKVGGTWKQWFASKIQDAFNRASTITGLGTADSGQPWNATKGNWRISGSNNAISDDAASTYPLASINLGNSDIKAQTDTTGGVGVAFWVTDAGSWWAAVPRYYTGTYQYQVCDSNVATCTGSGCTPSVSCCSTVSQSSSTVCNTTPATCSGSGCTPTGCCGGTTYTGGGCDQNYQTGLSSTSSCCGTYTTSGGGTTTVCDQNYSGWQGSVPSSSTCCSNTLTSRSVATYSCTGSATPCSNSSTSGYPGGCTPSGAVCGISCSYSTSTSGGGCGGTKSSCETSSFDIFACQPSGCAPGCDTFYDGYRTTDPYCYGSATCTCNGSGCTCTPSGCDPVCGGATMSYSTSTTGTTYYTIDRYIGGGTSGPQDSCANYGWTSASCGNCGVCNQYLLCCAAPGSTTTTGTGTCYTGSLVGTFTKTSCYTQNLPGTTTYTTTCTGGTANTYAGSVTEYSCYTSGRSVSVPITYNCYTATTPITGTCNTGTTTTITRSCYTGNTTYNGTNYNTDIVVISSVSGSVVTASTITVNTNTSGYTTVGSVYVTTTGNAISVTGYAGANLTGGTIGTVLNHTATNPTKGTSVGIIKTPSSGSQGSTTDNFLATI